jgi:hypothetical protein
MVALASHAHEVAEYWYNQALLNKRDLMLEDVWYGDQNLLPTTPSMCVLAGPTRREWNGGPYAVLHNFQVFFLVFIGKLQDKQLNEIQGLEIAGIVEDFIHADKFSGGLTLAGHVSDNEPGAVNRAGSWVRTYRLTYQAISKTLI